MLLLKCLILSVGSISLLFLSGCVSGKVLFIDHNEARKQMVTLQDEQFEDNLVRVARGEIPIQMKYVKITGKVNSSTTGKISAGDTDNFEENATTVVLDSDQDDLSGSLEATLSDEFTSDGELLTGEIGAKITKRYFDFVKKHLKVSANDPITSTSDSYALIIKRKATYRDKQQPNSQREPYIYYFVKDECRNQLMELYNFVVHNKETPKDKNKAANVSVVSAIKSKKYPTKTENFEVYEVKLSPKIEGIESGSVEIPGLDNGKQILTYLAPVDRCCADAIYTHAYFGAHGKYAENDIAPGRYYFDYKTKEKASKETIFNLTVNEAAAK